MLWVDINTSCNPEDWTSEEYNLREDIQCLKEDIHELVAALHNLRSFEDSYDTCEQVLGEILLELNNLVNKYGGE